MCEWHMHTKIYLEKLFKKTATAIVHKINKYKKSIHKLQCIVNYKLLLKHRLISTSQNNYIFVDFVNDPLFGVASNFML